MLNNAQIQKLNGEYTIIAVAKLAAVAPLCVQDEPDFRANMSIVVRALQQLLKATPATMVEVQPSVKAKCTWALCRFWLRPLLHTLKRNIDFGRLLTCLTHNASLLNCFFRQLKKMSYCISVLDLNTIEFIFIFCGLCTFIHIVQCFIQSKSLSKSSQEVLYFYASKTHGLWTTFNPLDSFPYQ